MSTPRRREILEPAKKGSRPPEAFRTAAKRVAAKKVVVAKKTKKITQDRFNEPPVNRPR